MALTQKEIANTRPEPGERRELWDRGDGSVPGLHVRIWVDRSGVVRRRWFIRYRANGRQRRLSLGDWAMDSQKEERELRDGRARRGLSLKDARDKAGEVRSQVKAGGDPQLERRQAIEEAKAKRAAAAAGTVKGLAKEYLDHLDRKQRRRKAEGLQSKAEVWRQLEKDVLPAIGEKPAGEVTEGDVEAILDAIEKRGAPVLAKRVRSRLIGMFAWGSQKEEWGKLITGNPALGVEAPLDKEVPRDRLLSEDELKRLWTAAQNLTPAIGAAFRFRMLTGQRWTEIATARWDDIKVEQVGDPTAEMVLWVIPKERTKTRRNAHTVPLSPEAIAVIEPLRELGSEWIFPAPGDPKKPLLRVAHHVASAFREWKASAEVDDFIGKDLRRAMTTGLARLKVGNETREAVLNHAPTSTMKKHYDRYDYVAEKHAALVKWGREIDRIVSRKKARVVEFPTG